MHKLLAFVRRDGLVAASYRTNMVLSLGSLLMLVVPMYFVANAVQPVVGDAIRAEGGEYFAFVVAGMATYQFVMAAVGAVPNALMSGIRTGTFEALLTTPTRLSVLLFGMAAYPFLWSVIRALAMMGAGQTLGAEYHLERAAPVLLIWAVITLAYVPFGILAGALLLVIRSTGPLPTLVLTASMLLGGVYYPSHVVPTWVRHLADVLPLTYGLRALRKVLATDVPLAHVASDLAMLGLLTGLFLLVSLLGFHLALNHARRTGSLAQY